MLLWFKKIVTLIFILIIFSHFGTTQGSNNATNATLFTDSIFSSNSFWYEKIPFDTPLHSQSADFVNDFLRQKNAFYKKISINLTSYSSPVYVVGKEVAAIQVTQWACSKPFRGADLDLAEQWVAVPIPDYAEPADGSDAEMTVYQPSTDTIWEFWKARKVNGHWQACWGGKMTHASQNEGRWHGSYGATATGLPFLGGQITAEELQRGEIRHVIGISLPELESRKIFSWPAKRSDGFNPNNALNRIPEGLRFRLDPSVNVDALKMHRAAKVIAKAAQIYGFVIWDHAGAITVRSQNPKSYTQIGQPNPYPEIFNYVPAWAILDGFPWDKLQFLPMHYGKPTPPFPVKNKISYEIK